MNGISVILSYKSTIKFWTPQNFMESLIFCSVCKVQKKMQNKLLFEKLKLINSCIFFLVIRIFKVVKCLWNNHQHQKLVQGQRQRQRRNKMYSWWSHWSQWKSWWFLPLRLSFNPFLTNAPLPYPLKTSENFQFFIFSGGTEVLYWLKMG